MVKIKNNRNGEVYTLHGASLEFATKDSVIVNRIVGNRFRINWHGVFAYYMPLTRSTQCILSEEFEVLNAK